MSSKPSILYAKILDAVNAPMHCDIPAGTSHYEQPSINSREKRIEKANIEFELSLFYLGFSTFYTPLGIVPFITK